VSGGCDRERTDEERAIDGLRRDLADRTAELAAIADMLDEAGIGHRDGDTVRTRLARMIADANTEAERTEKAEATVERLIREAGAIRLDERQRAEAEHRALADEGRQRDANRIERLEGEVARLRVIVDDADRAKAEHEKTRDELRRLHDVLSGKRSAADEAGFKAYKATLPPLLRCDGACGYSCRLSHLKPGARCPNDDGTLQPVTEGDLDR